MSVRRNRKRPRLTLDVLEDDGGWAWLDDARSLAESAAAEVATEPDLNLESAQATVVLSSNAKVEILNGQFRGKPKPTNVLSFPTGSGAPTGFIGDIVLAGETVQREAEAEDIPPEHHFQHLVVHGLLHLLGFDHETDKQAERMEALEIRILARLGIASPYTAPLETDTQ